MVSSMSRSSMRNQIQRLAISNSELALDKVEELLYISKTSDTTADLKRPRAASESNLIADEELISYGSQSISPPHETQKHIYGQHCPDNNENCHYHHQLTQHCHLPWHHCASALHAIRQSCRAGGDWMGAPDGWNKEHEPCLKTQKKCDIHAGIQGMSIQEQRNKKYPEKPRVREKSNRGSGNLKKRGNDSDLLQQASRCSARADSTTRWNYA